MRYPKKFIHTCAGCGQGIALGVDGLIVAAASLGPGFFHNSCARRRWDEQRRADEKHDAAVRAKRSAAMKARHVARVASSTSNTPSSSSSS